MSVKKERFNIDLVGTLNFNPAAGAGGKGSSKSRAKDTAKGKQGKSTKGRMGDSSPAYKAGAPQLGSPKDANSGKKEETKAPAKKTEEKPKPKKP